MAYNPMLLDVCFGKMHFGLFPFGVYCLLAYYSDFLTLRQAFSDFYIRQNERVYRTIPETSGLFVGIAKSSNTHLSTQF